VREGGSVKKTLYTLNVNGYAPEITALTFPLLKHYAAKIGAEFHVITERKYPEMPITFEKFQVSELAQERGDEWSIFFDADTLIDPEQFDITNHLPKDTVAHNGSDFSGIRWTWDKYMKRDGRGIGSCTWCVIASDMTVEDLWWKPFPHTADEHGMRYALNTNILPNIHITVGEHNSGHCQREHLIDDYLLSRNISRFGLKFTTVSDICSNLGVRGPNGAKISPWLWHLYTLSNEAKVKKMLAVMSTAREQPAFEEKVQIGDSPQGPVGKTADGRVISPCGRGWGLMGVDQANAFRKEWNIK
jgi:hypothetical protein